MELESVLDRIRFLLVRFYLLQNRNIRYYLGNIKSIIMKPRSPLAQIRFLIARFYLLLFLLVIIGMWGVWKFDSPILGGIPMKFSWSSLFGTNGYQEIHNRAKAGDTAWVKHYLERGGDPSIKAAGDVTPLYFATKAGHFDTVKILVEYGADVHQKLDDTYNPDFTPVLAAAYEGREDIVEFLLENGAEKDIYLSTILGDLDAIKKYVEGGGDININRQKGTDKPHLSGKTLLHLATWRDSIAVVELLLENGANINVRDRRGITPLHNAVALNSQNSAQFLIEKDADINAINRKKGTPLHSAATFGRAEMVNLLIASGARINAQNSHGDTSLHLASKQNHIEVVKILIAYGADKNIRNEAGSTPLILAKFHSSNPEIIDLLQK